LQIIAVVFVLQL